MCRARIPDGFSVNARCIDSPTVTGMKINPSNGRNWEKHYPAGPRRVQRVSEVMSQLRRQHPPVRRCRAARRGAGDPRREFTHLERAHVLGQASTREHVRVHWRMLLLGAGAIAMRAKFFGQVFRIVGAATKTFIGLVPAGNTGGANVSPVRPMPIDPELAAIIEKARASAPR